MPETQIQFPIDEVRWILHACRADEPLAPEDPRRYDFTELRGGHSVITELVDTLEQECVAGEYHQQILCGHRGAGKTTELLGLQKWANANGFLCLWMDIEAYFGKGTQLHYSDLYLMAAESVEVAMREDVKYPLHDSNIQEIRQWFAEITREEKREDKSELVEEGGAEAKAEIPLLGKIFASFKARRQDSVEHLQTVRNRVRQRSDTLVSMTRKLLEMASSQLKQHPGESLSKGEHRPHGLLLIFDSMDRFEEENIKALLHNSSALRSLACHVVYTMPINLMYKPESAYWDIYSPPVVLPMLSLRTRRADWRATVADSPYEEHAINMMLEALNKRIVVTKLFENPEDARLLVRMSGGCLRDLMHLVNGARKYSRIPDRPLTSLTSDGVRKGIAEYRLILTEGLDEQDYRLLAEVARGRVIGDRLDAPVLKLLNRRVMLRYSRDNLRWNDVHPLVIETEGFQHAFAHASPLNNA